MIWKEEEITTLSLLPVLLDVFVEIKMMVTVHCYMMDDVTWCCNRQSKDKHDILRVSYLRTTIWKMAEYYYTKERICRVIAFKELVWKGEFIIHAWTMSMILDLGDHFVTSYISRKSIHSLKAAMELVNFSTNSVKIL